MGLFRKNTITNSLTIAVPHIDGLPISNNDFVKITGYKDKIVFEHQNNTYELFSHQLRNIYHTNDVDIQKQISSSAGGAIAGYAMLGVVGALVGGRSKENTIRNFRLLLVFEYEDSNNEIKHLTFETTHTPKSKQFTMEYFGREVVNRTIQL